MSCPDSCNNFWLVCEREFCACWTQVHIFGNSFRTKYFSLGVLETLGDGDKVKAQRLMSKGAIPESHGSDQHKPRNKGQLEHRPDRQMG